MYNYTYYTFIKYKNNVLCELNCMHTLELQACHKKFLSNTHFDWYCGMDFPGWVKNPFLFNA